MTLTIPYNFKCICEIESILTINRNYLKYQKLFTENIIHNLYKYTRNVKNNEIILNTYFNVKD